MQALLLLGVALAADAGLDLGEHPVAKVTRLLQDMQAELAKEKKADAELYDQLDCWCETNKKQKDSAVDSAQRRIAALGAQVEEHSAKAASLQTGIAKLQEEIARCNKSLSTAAAIRSKEHAEFADEDKELLTSIESVGSALDTLSKHHGSFLQVASVGRSVSSAQLTTLVQGVKAVLPAHSGLKPSQRKVLEAFLQQPADFNSYNSRSGPIYGILQQMKETFEQSMTQAQAEESRARDEFAALSAAKNREVSAAKGAVMDKTQQLAETDEAKVHAKSEAKATADALSADQQFLLDLQTRCTNGDEEYAKRTQMRDTELAAVGDAIAILTEDSARDLFSSTLSFLDVGGAKAKAAQLLRKAGAATGSDALVALASKVQLDAFTKVIAAVDEMAAALKKEMADEVEQQRFCASELQSNAKEQAAKNQKITDLTLSLEDMAGSTDTLKGDIKQLKAEVSETNTAIKRASEDREAENAAFQQTVADQRATQMILAKVLARLNKVYAGFVQTLALSQTGAEPAPPDFNDYKQASGAGSVLSMIQKIMADANGLEKDALNAEQDAQAAYEGFVKDSARSVSTANRSIAAKSEELAELETASVAAGGDKKAASADLERLGKFEGELHVSCDYVLKNFEARQTARGEEIDALHDAKAILSGADFD